MRSHKETGGIVQCIMVKFDVSSSGFRALLSPPALPTVGRFPSAGAARFDPQTRKEPSNHAFLVTFCRHVLNAISMTQPAYRHQHLPLCIYERYGVGGAVVEALWCRIFDRYPTLRYRSFE